jgi:predicted DNA-binding transcriptional regulator YafY
MEAQAVVARGAGEEEGEMSAEGEERRQYRAAEEALRLCRRLRETGEVETTASLSEALGVDRRKVSDLMAVVARALPGEVEEARQGRSKGLRWRGERGGGAQLGEDGAVVFALARQALGALRGSRMMGRLDAWIERLEAQDAAFREAHLRWRRRLVVRDRNSFVAWGEAAAALDVVLSALQEGRRVSFLYENFRGERRRREVAPLSLLLSEDEPYLVAQEGKDRRLFTLHSIWEARLEGESAYPPPGEYHPQQLFEASFGHWISDRAPEEVTLRFVAGLSTWVSRHRWHPSQSNRVLGDGQVEVRLLVRGDDPDLLRFVLGFGGQVEVLSPPGLREAAARALREGAARYRGG